MNSFTHVPPGFRFHPTDEELVDYYLRKKISSGRIDLDVIQDIDLYKIEPWDLQEKCKIGTKEQSEWYFFSHKDKKYPTGTRTNRATTVGFWKATGRDKAIYCKHSLVGMRKTLVFYEGRAPNGQKSDYIMHEYRLETNENAAPQEEGWVVCRVFKKRIPTVQRGSEHDSPCWYDEHVSFMPPQVDCSKRFAPNIDNTSFNFPYSACKKELTLQYHNPFDSFLQLPQLESPSKATNSSKATVSCTTLASYGLDMNRRSTILDSSSSSSSVLKHEEMQQYLNLLYDENNNDQQAVDQVTDWRVLEKFVASQLSQSQQQDHISNKEVPIDDYSDGGDGCNASDDHMNILLRQSNNEELAPPAAECASTSTSSIDLWKIPVTPLQTVDVKMGSTYEETDEQTDIKEEAPSLEEEEKDIQEAG